MTGRDDDDGKSPPPVLNLARIRELRLQRELEGLQAENLRLRTEMLGNLTRVAEMVWPDLGPLSVEPGYIYAVNSERLLLAVDPEGDYDEKRVVDAMISALGALLGQRTLLDKQ